MNNQTINIHVPSRYLKKKNKGKKVSSTKVKKKERNCKKVKTKTKHEQVNQKGQSINPQDKEQNKTFFSEIVKQKKDRQITNSSDTDLTIADDEADWWVVSYEKVNQIKMIKQE